MYNIEVMYIITIPKIIPNTMLSYIYDILIEKLAPSSILKI